MKAVYVGDMHATVEELAECQLLILAIVAFALQQGADTVVFLGDQYHTHSVMRVEVMAFWRNAFKILHAAGLRVICLVGNHDLSQGGEAHSMLAHDNVIVVDSPQTIDGVAFIPYMYDKAGFIKACAATPAGVLVCHQTFDGAQYENGFYAGDEGINPDTVPHQHIISGHIHRPQQFGKVWYVGAPRWRTLSDANTDRAVWCVDHSLAVPPAVCGAKYDTGLTCKRMLSFEDRPEVSTVDEIRRIQAAAGGNVDIRVDVYGPKDHLLGRVAELKALGCRVRTFRTDAPVARARESEGVWVAFDKYVNQYRPSRGTPLPILTKLAAERFKSALTA